MSTGSEYQDGQAYEDFLNAYHHFEPCIFKDYESWP
jgi:hypothetical protein